MELLERHFEIALETPDGIKKLRELILSLAMQGKLVPQDPNDQPASELLKEIEAEKKKLIKEGKIKKQESLPPIKPEEIPYEVPKGWEWVRLDVLGITQTGTTPPKKELENFGSFIPFIGPGDIKNCKINYSNNGLSEVGLTKGRLIYANSIMMVCIGGSIGKLTINEIDVTCNQQINTITPYKRVDCMFLFYVMQSNLFQNLVIVQAGGSATPIINKQKWSSICTPIAPIAEQKRIVAKIDQLMALCVKLEAERNERNQKRLTIHTAATNRLLSAPNKIAFNTSWGFITSNFGELYSVPENVEELKKAILQLAVMGKLVPQDPNDQPASELLKEIEAEKKKLIKEGKIKKQPLFPPIKPEEIPYELPKGWEWCRLSRIAHALAGNSFNSQDFSTKEGTKCIKITNTGVHNFIETNDYLPSDFLERYSNFKVSAGDIIIALTRPFIKEGLKVSVCPDSYDNSLLNQRVAAIKTFKTINSMYLFQYLKSPMVLSVFKNRFGNNGLQPNLKMNDLTDLLIPLPSFAEQKRIVAKIDQLMELCNTLEQQINSSTNKQTAILNAVLAKV